MRPGAIDFLFLTSETLVQLGGRVTAYGASARLGSLAPMYALAQLGYLAQTVSVTADFRAAESAVRAAKRVVFGEIFELSGDVELAHICDAYRRLWSLVPATREQVIFSIADDKFERPRFLEFYREVLPNCLAVTVVSEALAQKVRALTSRPVRIAPEPFEGTRGAPHAVAGRSRSRALGWLARCAGMSSDALRTRLLWFGYPMNLPPLLAMLPQLDEFSRRCALLLTCVTTPVAQLSELLTPERTSENASLRVEFLQWSAQAMDAAIASCDLILIPSDYRNPVVRAKSPNRLVAGLHGGRFVIAHPIPAYEPYRPFAWIGEDLCEGLRWAITHPTEVMARIAAGQRYIDQRHSPEAIARFWLELVQASVASAT